MSPRRFLPKLSFVNYRKAYPQASTGCFTSWFRIDRYWSGRIVQVSIKHFALSFDFRGNWLQDMEP